MKVRNCLLMYVLLGLFLHAHIQAIPNYVAGGLTMITGLAGALGGCEIANYMFYDNDLLNLVGVGGGFVVAGYCGGSFFYNYTPAGRIKRARALVQRAQQHTLAKQDVSNVQQVLKAVASVYTGNCPLVIAVKDLSAVFSELNNAHNLAVAAKKEDAHFKKDAQQLFAQIATLKPIFSTIVIMLQKDPGYVTQLEVCKQEEKLIKELYV